MCGLLLNGIWGGGGHVWSTLRLRLRLGIVSGWGILKLNVFGACLIHISWRGCGAKQLVDLSRPDNLGRKQ